MTTAIATLQADVYALRDHFNNLSVDKKISFESEVMFAVQILSGNDYLQKVGMSNRQSLVDAVSNIAAIGISLNPIKKQAYLVPRKGRICLDISYMGLMDLAVATGAIQWAKAEPVFEGEAFMLNGINQPPTHTRNPFAKSTGEFSGVYVVAKTSGGDYLTDTMSAEEVNGIRDRSEAWKAWVKDKKACPWVTDYNEMAKKTVVKRASKYWPGESERMQQAIHLLNTEGDEGIGFAASAPAALGFDAAAWCNKAEASNTLPALLVVWKEGAAAAIAAKDKGGYALIRNAVAERRTALEAKRTVDEAVTV